MKKLLVAAAIVAGSCTLALAQATPGTQGGAGPSATPSMTETPKAGAKSEDRMPSKKVMMKKKKTKKAKSPT